MDPTVTAAAIGVGGTVIVGVAGFSAAIWNTRRTVGLARESRVWDRRAQAYVDALSAMHYRQMRREHELQTTAVDKQASQLTTTILATYKAPDFHELEARLQAFASKRVVGAAQESSHAHDFATVTHKRWQSLVTRFGVADERCRALAGEVTMALSDADSADDAVVELIRRELQGKGKPLGDWRPSTLLSETSTAQEDSPGI